MSWIFYSAFWLALNRLWTLLGYFSHEILRLEMPFVTVTCFTLCSIKSWYAAAVESHSLGLYRSRCSYRDDLHSHRYLFEGDKVESYKRPVIISIKPAATKTTKATTDLFETFSRRLKKHQQCKQLRKRFKTPKIWWKLNFACSCLFHIVSHLILLRTCSWIRSLGLYRSRCSYRDDLHNNRYLF